jgi:hypothetical protein
MLPVLMLLAMAFTGTASADFGQASLGDNLRSLIQAKMSINVENEGEILHQVSLEAKAINCVEGAGLFCPLRDPPDVIFGPDGGVMSTSAPPCCPNKYLQCQVQQGVPYCRTLGYYTIQQRAGNDQEVCPPTSPACSRFQGNSELTRTN